MLGFVVELLRVGGTRPGVSDDRFGALRPAVLRLKALSRGRRLWRPGAACNSSVTGLGGRGSSGCSVNELAGLFDARGPSLRQQLGRSLQNGAHAQLYRPARRSLEASSRPPLAFVLARGRLDWSPDESPAYPRGSGQLVAVS